jgi:hypothetical protein
VGAAADRPPFGPSVGRQRLKDRQRENATLKRFLADTEVENIALKEIANENN